MKLSYWAGVCAGLFFLSSAPYVVEAPAQAQASNPEYQLTRDVRRAAQRAQVAIAQNNFPAANVALTQASSAARTDGDRYLIASVQLDVGNRTFNTAAQAAAIDVLIQSPLVDETRRANLYYHRARIAFNARDMATARTMLTTSVERGSTNPRTYIALASMYAQARDYTNAIAMIERALEIQRIAAVPVSEDWYRRAIDIALRLGDPNKVVQFSQGLVAVAPTSHNWRDALINYRNAANMPPEAEIDVWRLQLATGALAGEADYLNYARIARTAGALPEVERLVQSGRSASHLDGRNSEIVTLDRGTTAAAQSMRNAIAGRATAAAGQATGEAALTVANDYMVLGQFAEAAPLYRAAIEKGGVDADLANLRLGMALSLTGDLDGARTALDAVTGTRTWLARLWRTYADTRPPAVPVPAAS